ncbi:MAG: proprotein convertase P-domain-containing protein [Phycisphaerales bacterium]|nr:proprotein convertase P-domain-containing protein [Phycisphaerales bacterium]
MLKYRWIAGVLVGAAGVSATFATDVPEEEPNENKAAATQTANTGGWGVHGDTLSGSTTGSSTSPGQASADFFLVQTQPAAAAIYRHRLVITTSGTAGHSGALMGTAQSGVPSDTTTVQTTSTTSSPPRFNQWYGFGHEEQLYYRITGTASTTSPYLVMLETETISPNSLGTFQAGEFVLTTRAQGHTTDTEIFLYDSNFNLIRWNDDAPAPATGTQSEIVQGLSAGTYYLAVSTFSTAIAPANEAVDRSVSGNRFDLPDAIARNSSSSTSVNVSFAISDSAGTTQFGAALASSYEIYWSTFDVTGVAGACCLPNGTCRLATATACGDLNGQYQGDGTDCSGTSCPGVGACCLPTGNCLLIAEFACDAAGGNWLGLGTACGGGDYPAPTQGPQGFEDISSTGTPLTFATQDDSASAITLPFPFTFYGQAKTNGLVSTNGYITFGTVGTDLSNDQIPTTATANDAIYVLWDDLHLRTTGVVYVQELGTAPYRRYIVQWTNMDQFSPSNSSNLMTFQAKLFESSNCIEYHYLNIVPETPVNDYTVGVENSTGTIATAFPAANLGSGFTRLVFCPSAGDCPQPNGGCCLPDGTCQLTTYAGCQTQFGDFRGFDSDCAAQCPGPRGGCCLPDGSCQVLEATACASQGGVYGGDGTNCAGRTCSGACCLNDGTCTVTGQAGCAQQGGTYRGDGTNCDGANPCVGACCLPDGGCQEITEAACQTAGGAYSGGATLCANTVCTGGCCFVNGSCQDLGPGPCASQGGTYRGNGTDCSPNECPQPPIGACCLGDNSCQNANTFDCTTLGGTWLGETTNCLILNQYASSPNLPIADNSTITDTINVPDSFSVGDLNVDLLIQHTFQGDIIVTLTSPGGTTKNLVNRPGRVDTGVGFGNNNYGNPTSGAFFTLDDQAAFVYDTGSPGVPVDNPTGNWLPDLGPLSDFNGQDALGTWTLTVSDNATIDTGTLITWRLNFGRPDPNVCGQTDPCEGQQLGDANCDGLLNNFDIDCFVLALTTDEATWAAMCNTSGNCDFVCVLDINGDGNVNNFDIDPFVACLTEGCP